MGMNTLARFLVIAGMVLILAGGVAYLLGRLNLPLGSLPGDIRIVARELHLFDSDDYHDPGFDCLVRAA